jgi:tRNA pseudouridine55 synthase
MNEVVVVNKLLGQTPLEAIDALREQHPELANKSITYAGRLDPMAEGLLLLLIGDAVHQKEQFLALPKTYEAKILLGVNSDSYDILGLVSSEEFTRPTEFEIQTAVSSLIGIHQLPYPAFSSKTVDGKPLWLWTKENKQDQITIPTREMTVLSAELTSNSPEQWKNIFQYATTAINKLSGDFRQTEVFNSWEKLNQQFKSGDELTILDINFQVSSGTYIRTLAVELGKKLNCPALLYQLKRTSIGDYQI